jgi:hypothetical protein
MSSFIPKDPFPTWHPIDQDECLIVEELCRVIKGARRFQTIQEAWGAIQATRRLARSIRDDVTELGRSVQPNSEALRAAGGDDG